MESDFQQNVVLAIASLLVAPLAGILAAAALPNPPGNGPGVGQVLGAGLVPIAVVCVAAVVVRARLVSAVAWALVGVLTTGGLILLYIWAFVAATGGVD